jgi:hypothetical protein
MLKKKSSDDSMLSWIPCRFLKLDLALHTNLAEAFIHSTVDNVESCRDYFTSFLPGRLNYTQTMNMSYANWGP